MRILLVNPLREGRGQTAVRFMNATPLALPLLKSLTPDDVEVRIVDENIEPLDFEEPYDLVGVTVMLHVSQRAIEIASEFKKRGAKVVFGGFFPSLWPEQALPYVDAIVSGEAEYVWRDLVEDARRNRLKKIYRADRLADLRDVPFIPKRFYTDQESYHVETTRGCPYHCDYCSVTTFYGNKFRHRIVDAVVKQVAECNDRFIFFVDDNITANPKYAKEVFRAIAPLKVSWSGQFSINFARDEELLDIAADAGCRMLFCGLETLNSDCLEEVGKEWASPAQYPEYIRRIRARNIGVYGSFMFGFEHDKPDVFRRTLDFCEENKVDLALFGAMYPREGSKTYQKLKAEGRIFEGNTKKANGQYATYIPKNMKTEELDEGLRWIWKEFFSKRSIKARLGNHLENTNFLRDGKGTGQMSTSELMVGLNMAFKAAVTDF